MKGLVGFELLNSGLEMLSAQNKGLIAEQCGYSCQRAEQLLQLGFSRSMSALLYMEEGALASIAHTMSNQ